MSFWKRKGQATVDVGTHGDRDFRDAMIWAYRSIASRFFDVVGEAWELWRETSGWPLSFRETARAAELPTWSVLGHGLRPDESENPNNRALAEAGEWLRRQAGIMYGDLRVRDALYGASLFWLYTGECLRGFSEDQLRVVRLHGISFLAVVYFRDDIFVSQIERRAMKSISHKIKELGGVI